ncbi:GFA family protein [Rhodophyticola sp.]|uniref:GFA family protein n=1 Tax=Rhodophyticola sp. TaxID=2680032 RepID=UPI003D2A0C58
MTQIKHAIQWIDETILDYWQSACMSEGVDMDDNRTTGQCLCGAVKFSISGEFESFFLCHCARCRKDSGSAHSANLFSTTAKVNWVSDHSNITTFRLSGSRHIKSFCNNCGSALPVFQVDLGLLVVPAGSLDSRIDIRPNAHICFSSRADWDSDLASIERIDGLPG